MRNSLWAAIGLQNASHFGYAYQRMAPDPKDGKANSELHGPWLERCEGIAVDADYRHFYDLWKSGFHDVRWEEVEAGSRLLIGHGNASGADVGLTVHHTWGVPLIPGRALKGLLAHYIDASYGDDRRWRAATWTGNRVMPGMGAGSLFAALFGAPAEDNRQQSARSGAVEFQDALYIPEPASKNKPYRRDVLTVHQREYYNKLGATEPTDWDSPNPVGFITVRPDTRFLLALTGPKEWRDLAMELLLRALVEWGVGAKTSAGYGRLAQAPPKC